MTTNNPLKQYFRQPSIYSPLPSKGEYYGEGALEMPETNEVAIYPMTAIDVITYKTPDALFNGSAIVDVIKSCVPAIKDPWEMPSFDLNMLLIAIRIASVGHEYEIASTCPKCSSIADFVIDLRLLLDNMPDISLYKEPLNVGDLSIYFKPLVYKDINKNNKIQFEEQKLMQVLHNDQIEDTDKMTALSNAFKKIASFTVETMTRSIEFIKTTDATVTDADNISEFLTNCDKEVFDLIKARLFELKEIEDLKDLDITCAEDECKHEYKQPYTLDMTTFFEENS